MKWTFRVNWCSPRNYVFRRWLFNWGWYGFMGYIRIAGLLFTAVRKDSIVKPEKLRAVNVRLVERLKPMSYLDQNN